MSRIFVSHSSRDHEFAQKLEGSLKALGHAPWLDEYEIRVGDCIVSRVGDGLSQCDYLVVVLTPAAIESGWVEREWKSKYWDEIATGRVALLPALVVDCEIPHLLRTRKYADFRRDYGAGLVQLVGAISPLLRTDGNSSFAATLNDPRISALIARVQSGSTRLSECVAQGLELAIALGATDLERFCRAELTGEFGEGVGKATPGPKYRWIEIFISIRGHLNMQYQGWGGNVGAVMNYMRTNPKAFCAVKITPIEPLSVIERSAETGDAATLVSMSVNHKHLFAAAADSDASAPAYASGDVYLRLLESIRSEFTCRLVDLLPRIAAAGPS